MTKHDELYLWFLGNPRQPRLVGRLNPAIPGNHVSLTYDANWLQSGFPLSADLPLRSGTLAPARGDAAPRAAGAVDDAMPDRWGQKVIRAVEKPARLSLMEFLYYAGDERFGALGVSSSESVYEPKARTALPRLKDAGTVDEAIQRINASRELNETMTKFISGSGSPLGGAKPKAVIEINGEAWIVKFFNNEPVDAPLVEHATLTLAAQAGIEVAQSQVIRVSGVNALAVRRFDRNKSARVHAISAHTAIRSQPDLDLGYPGLAQVLRRSGVAQDQLNEKQMVELFHRMVFNILIDNTDDHDKNHALLMDDPFGVRQWRLAPAYDVLPTASGQGNQLFRCGKEGYASTLSNAMSECAQFGVTHAIALSEIESVVRVVDTWKRHFAALGVTPKDIDTLAQTIDSAPLLSQRQDLSVLRATSSDSRSRRRSLFQR